MRTSTTRSSSLIPTDFVVHNEDHANNHIMSYCSQVYNRAVLNSCADPGVFTELSESPEQFKFQIKLCVLFGFRFFLLGLLGLFGLFAFWLPFPVFLGLWLPLNQRPLCGMVCVGPPRFQGALSFSFNISRGAWPLLTTMSNEAM